MDITLDQVRADIHRRLADAAGNRRSPMHIPVVATHDADVRMMVLRAFDPDAWSLRFHTDARSPKIRMLDNGAPVGVLFYHADEKIQMRCRGTAQIDRDSPMADEAWNASDAFARRCYLGQPPGDRSDVPTSGLPTHAEGQRPSEEMLASVREHFAILLIAIETIDWYSLAHTGHRRALLTGTDGHWLTP